MRERLRKCSCTMWEYNLEVSWKKMHIWEGKKQGQLRIKGCDLQQVYLHKRKKFTFYLWPSFVGTGSIYRELN